MAPRDPGRKNPRGPRKAAGTPALEEELLRRYAEAGTLLLADEAPRRLDPTLRAEMETLTGAGLGDVRLHAGPEARRMAQSLGARAFATGPADVFFAGGMPDTGTPQGKSLLAHELTHVAEGEAGLVGVARLPRRERLEIRARRVEEMVLAREQAAGQVGSEPPREAARVSLPSGPEGDAPRQATVDKDALENRVWQRLQRDEKRLRERTGHL